MTYFNIYQNTCIMILSQQNKCERYWPNDRVPLTFGDLQISLNSCQEHPFYILRVMTLTSEEVSLTTYYALYRQLFYNC